VKIICGNDSLAIVTTDYISWEDLRVKSKIFIGDSKKPLITINGEFCAKQHLKKFNIFLEQIKS
jgi:hypothetical protein